MHTLYLGPSWAVQSYESFNGANDTVKTNLAAELNYRYNENDLYNFKSYAWQQFNKWHQGKNAKNMWSEDGRRFAGYRPA